MQTLLGVLSGTHRTWAELQTMKGQKNVLAKAPSELKEPQPWRFGSLSQEAA